MTKVFNPNLSNAEVVLSFGTVQFDENGIADIDPHENAELLSKVDGFKIVDEKLQAQLDNSFGKVEEAKHELDAETAKRNALSTEPILPPGLVLPEEDEEEDTEETIEEVEEVEEEEVTEEVVEASEEMSHAELDALAKEVGLTKYGKGVTTKAEKADAINEFIASK